MFKIAWLYHDILNLYGDVGNILVLTHLLESNQIPYQVDKISLNKHQKLDDYDIIFIGGGSDQAQALIYKDFISRKQQIINCMNNNGFVLAICGGYQLCGQYYIDAKGNKIEGLDLFEYQTQAGNTRLNNNIYIKANLDNEEVDIVGYENHSGQTINVANPLGKVIVGNGNDQHSQLEGYIDDHFIGTYIHGPLLPKNPEIGKYIIQKVLKDKYNKEVSIIIDLKYANQAKQTMIKRLTKGE